MCGGLSSCFTGIESTPRITSSDVRNSGVRTTNEQSFSAKIKPEPPHTWTPGKQWRVADNKISLIFSPTASADSLAGKMIAFASERRVPSVTGIDGIELCFTSPDGLSLYYRPDLNADDWADRDALPIPFATEISPVMVADSLMRGNTYYITTPLWYDSAGAAVDGLRHIPVRIDSVIPGNDRYPLCVAFTPVNFDSPQRFVLMTCGNSSAATRNFDRIFSFTDPRRSYPSITDENWQKIIRSQIATGMTRDECRLALGSPDAIDHGATAGAQIERWRYDNGVYLIFEDGILERYRK